MPLIIRAPSVSPRRVADVVRLVDVMPTVLDLLRMPLPPMDGVSLVGMLRGVPQPVELDAYAESQYPLRFGWSSLRALRAGRYKLIDAPRPELYDLDRDPFEQRNIHDERGELAAALAKRLTTLAANTPVTGREDVADSIPAADLRERLAALGYIGSGTPARAGGNDLPDPKDCIDAFPTNSRKSSCAGTAPGSWPVPIGQLFMKPQSGATR